MPVMVLNQWIASFSKNVGANVEAEKITWVKCLACENHIFMMQKSGKQEQLRYVETVRTLFPPVMHRAS